MRHTPTLLFSATTALIILLGILTTNETLDIQLHDTYFIIEYLHLAIIISFLTGLTALTYYGLERFKRPIKFKTGFWHFGLFIAGLLLLVVSIILPTSTYYYETIIYSMTAIFFMGIILLLSSVVVFIYGVTKAIFNIKE